MGIRDYVRYRRMRFGVGRSFEFAFGRRLGDALLDVLWYTITVSILVWLLTESANALVAEYDARQADQKTYTANLERTLATCLSRGDNAVMIGDELWFCGATPAGVHPTRGK
jgi:hypothetical protein